MKYETVHFQYIYEEVRSRLQREDAVNIHSLQRYEHIRYLQYTSMYIHEDNETVVTIEQEDVPLAVFFPVDPDAPLSRGEYALVFAMSLHPRLGASCIYNVLDQGIIQLIIDLCAFQPEGIMSKLKPDSLVLALRKLSHVNFQMEMSIVFEFKTKMEQLSEQFLSRPLTTDEILTLKDMQAKWCDRIGYYDVEFTSRYFPNGVHASEVV